MGHVRPISSGYKVNSLSIENRFKSTGTGGMDSETGRLTEVVGIQLKNIISETIMIIHRPLILTVAIFYRMESQTRMLYFNEQPSP